MLDLDRRWTRPPPTRAQVRVDLFLAIGTAVLSVASVGIWHSAYGSSLGWRGVEGYLLFALAGLVLAGRRRLPMTTVIVESAVFIAIGERLVELGLIFTIQIILFAALYAAWAWSGATRRLYVVTGLVIATMFGWLLWSISKELPKMDRPDVGLLPADVSVIIYNLGLNIVYFFGAIAWGHVAWRSARQRAIISDQVEREQQNRLRERDRAVQAERVRIARDLHDVVAHHISGIGVQAAGAGRVLEAEPDATRRALVTIEQSSRTAVSQMHQLVGLLRSDGERLTGREPRPGLADLSTLATTDDRPAIAYREVGESFSVTATVGLSLFRVAQEAVANLRRHAHAGNGTVILRYVPESATTERSVEVEVIDDGSAAPAPSTEGGYGLIGIQVPRCTAESAR